MTELNYFKFIKNDTKPIISGVYIQPYGVQVS